VMLSERMRPVAPGSHEGTWVAAGAINDAGTAQATFTVEEQGQERGRVKGTHVLTNAAGDGTITLDFQAWLRPFPPPTPPRQVMVEGTWKLVAATGRYAGRKASGKLYGTADRTVSPPQVTTVYDGSAN
jgi:hypothetical protein